MEKSIGALWIKTGKNGEFWTGNIELPDGTVEKVIVFKNGFKEGNQPDYKIYKQQPKAEEDQITEDIDLPF